MSRHHRARKPRQRVAKRIALSNAHQPSVWPAATISTTEDVPANSPESKAHTPTEFPRLRALDLRTLRFLHEGAALLLRLHGLLRDLLSSNSPVSRGMRRLQGRGRRLQVAETVQLGEKRFVAILRVDGEQFLIGGSANNVSLLTSLAPSPATPAAEPAQVVALTEDPAHASSICDSPATFSAVLAAHSCSGGLA